MDMKVLIETKEVFLRDAMGSTVSLSSDPDNKDLVTLIIDGYDGMTTINKEEAQAIAEMLYIFVNS